MMTNDNWYRDRFIHVSIFLSHILTNMINFHCRMLRQRIANNCDSFIAENKGRSANSPLF